MKSVFKNALRQPVLTTLIGCIVSAGALAYPDASDNADASSVIE